MYEKGAAKAPCDNMLPEATNINQNELLKNNGNVSELHGVSLSQYNQITARISIWQQFY